MEGSKRHAQEDSLIQLKAALDSILLSDSPIEQIQRAPYVYGSSFPLDEVCLTFANGKQMKLLVKDLNPGSLTEAARAAKPAFLDDPLREIEVYRNIHDLPAFGGAKYYGCLVDPSSERYWLFLERVQGRELYQVGEFDIWKHVATVLAEFHHSFVDIESKSPSLAARLVRYSPEYYQLWLERAIRFQETNNSASCNSREAFELLRKIEQFYTKFAMELGALPSTLIHGECYASNVLVNHPNDPTRVCAVDWERAGYGPGLIDIATLTAGKWHEHQKRQIFDEYEATLRLLSSFVPSHADLLRAWNLCRMHLAIQWLGWSQNWSPPIEHQQDWLEKVRRMATQLGWNL